MCDVKSLWLFSQGLFFYETALHHCFTESIFLHDQETDRVRKRWLSAANGRYCFLALLHEDMLLGACLILSISGPTKTLKTSHRISVLLGCPCTFGTFGGQWHLRVGFSPLPSLIFLFHRFIMHLNHYPLFSYLCSEQHKHIKDSSSDSAPLLQMSLILVCASMGI